MGSGMLTSAPMLRLVVLAVVLFAQRPGADPGGRASPVLCGSITSWWSSSRDERRRSVEYVRWVAEDRIAALFLLERHDSPRRSTTPLASTYRKTPVRVLVNTALDPLGIVTARTWSLPAELHAARQPAAPRIRACSKCRVGL